MNAEQMKVKIAQYLRYKMQMPVVAFESACYGSNGQSDVLAIDTKRYLTDIEVKLSIADLRADINKPKHLYLHIAYHGLELMQDSIQRRKSWKRAWQWQELQEKYHRRPIEANHTRYFYFAFPTELVNDASKAVVSLYPYAGIYEVTEDMNYYGYYLKLQRKPYPFNVGRVSLKRGLNLVKGMSATLVRVSAKAEGVHLL